MLMGIIPEKKDFWTNPSTHHVQRCNSLYFR